MADDIGDCVGLTRSGRTLDNNAGVFSSLEAADYFYLIIIEWKGKEKRLQVSIGDYVSTLTTVVRSRRPSDRSMVGEDQLPAGQIEPVVIYLVEDFI
jgi:hypothetical protein